MRQPPTHAPPPRLCRAGSHAYEALTEGVQPSAAAHSQCRQGSLHSTAQLRARAARTPHAAAPCTAVRARAADTRAATVRGLRRITHHCRRH
eukprot:2848435-Pleurochrysis_carterae.AAC.3